MIPLTEGITLACRLYDALAAGNKPQVQALLHPRFSGEATAGLPLGLGGRYSNPDEMLRNFWGTIAKHFQAKAQPKDFHWLDDGRLYVRGQYSGQARGTGGALDAEFVHVLGFAEGRIVSLHQLTDSQRWVQAAAPAQGRFSCLEFSRDGGLAIIRLNRPNMRNAINEQMTVELSAVANLCANDCTVRALLILGNGASFTAGGDLALFAATDPAELPGLLRRMTVAFHSALRLLSRLEVPIVAGVHGAVIGGGLGIMYSADIVVAAEQTRFATGFGGLGLSMDGGNSWYLPRLVGARRAAEMYFEGRVLEAREAQEWGLLNRVVPATELEQEALATARRLANGPTRGFAQTRRLFRDAWTATLDEQLSAETDALSTAAATLDAQAGIQAFINKSRATFQGQ